MACSSRPRCRTDDQLDVDLDAYAEHIRWLAANGCDGVDAERLARRVPGPHRRRARRRRAHRGRGRAGGVQRDPRRRRLRRAGVAPLGRAGRRGRGRTASCCCRPTPTAPTSAPSSRTTRRSPRSACRSSPTTTPSTPRSTSSPNCSPSCTTQGSIVRRQGVLRRRAPRLPDRRARARARPARRRRRRPARARARRRQGLDLRLPERLPGDVRRALPRRRRPATWSRRCPLYRTCTRCCAGTPGPSSSRRSSCRWTWPAATAVPAGRRASR